MATTIGGRAQDSSPLAAPPRAPLVPAIQLLRAVAVLAVVGFHFWPGKLTGGFVGVDVFFVISGYLITSHLLRELDSTSRIRFGAFYGRRIRRLLPAAALVTLVTLAACWVVEPRSDWNSIFADAIAASAYFLNFRLAATSTDYFAAQAGASPFQHYWSLSAEEQFYLIWPALLALVWLLGRSGRHRSRSATPVIAAVAAFGLASLAFSIWYSSVQPSAAYLVTPTRIWEFCAGALPAVVRTLRPRSTTRPRIELLATALGLTMIVVAVVAFRESMPFPSWTALLPVVGTTLVVGTSSASQTHLIARLSRLRIVDFFGRISYSLYLWHWPIVILVPLALGHPVTTPAKLLMLALAIVLATAGYLMVERPFLIRRRLGVRTTVAVLVVCELVALVPATATIAITDAQNAAAKASVNSLIGGSCFGAAAAGHDCPGSHDVSADYPATAAASDSVPKDDGCLINDKSIRTVRVCTFGQTTGTPRLRIALVGDSHAEMELPALDALAKQNHWRITTMLRGLCPVMDRNDPAADATDNCAYWSDQVSSKVKSGDFDLVITTAFMGWQRDSYLAQGLDPDVMTQFLLSSWSQWEASGEKVLAIASTPRTGATGTGVNIPDCIEKAASSSDPCTLDRAQALPPDPITQAAQLADPKKTRLLDLTDVFCDQKSCHSVVGGLIAYRDESHFTATFARTLEPRLASALSGLGIHVAEATTTAR